MSLIHNPHDKFFKETFGDVGMARSFLKNYLPQEILALVDLETILPQKDSYIDQELQESFSDLLFQVKIHKNEGYLYFLFEHKSYPSQGIALQLLKYMVRIWESKLKESKPDKLPLIIPMVVYHGQEKWNSSLKLSGIIDNYEQLPNAVTQYIPEYEYILYDLSTYTDQEMVGNMLLLIILRTMRDIFIKDTEAFHNILHELLISFERVEDQEKGMQFFETLIRYILSTRQDLELERIYEIAKEVSLERGEVMMTIAEKLIMEGMEKGLKKGREEGLKKGREEGLEKGREEGLEKGREETKLEVARNLLGLGIEMDKVAKATGLSEEEIRKLMN
ncbi:Rpn family recombination-promoting nuclease/putative transposase [Desulfitobacterium hafniense]|uniref:Transposase (putative) YhgA-like domain-containing protein n=3 Tax=Desulfitobacterium hafniense TaxID=49338 RepID=Q24W02_DESHY|nr:Rpn family recombination-promoting nuclease/putative transposase [Desulfitobacterium hafniense]EHL06493.1 putative transposase, YhgA [Desulfitobacterium hafniense DP7]KTE93223.1 transposase [Desulfitobacterium hafniense]BAE83790.1 hypothetical protein DSY2001 [Desulfitobacterium hafniense Y51]